MRKFYKINSAGLLILFATLFLADRVFAQTYTINTGGTVSTCSGTFFDSGNTGGNYGNNESYTMTFCSTGPASCVKLTFNSFNTQKDNDTLTVFDGPNTSSPTLGTYSGNVSPGIVISSPGGCLTFRFKSNASTVRAGWSADITCSCVPPNTDCINKKPICNDITLNDNNNGKGKVNDLNGANQGCLATNENQSSWYSVTFTSSGTFNFSINPTNGTDDYDFAIYGPAAACPPTGLPTRCSYCPPPYGVPLDYKTGLKAGGGGTTEGATVCDGWLNELNVVVGETYIIIIDNFSGTNSGFTLDLGGTALRECAVPVPIELLSFSVRPVNNKALITWQTASELNSDYFKVERSKDAVNFETVSLIKGKGYSASPQSYFYNDENPYSGVSYYRLQQVDSDGQNSYSQTIPFKNNKFSTKSSLIGGNLLNIQFDDIASDKIFVAIYDAMGRILYKQLHYSSEGNNNINIDVSTFNNGIYFIQLIKSNETMTIKVIK